MQYIENTQDVKEALDSVRAGASTWALFRREAKTTLEELTTELAALGNLQSHRRGLPLVYELRPTPSEDALPKSLSAIHGIAGFPAHVDGAHLPVPPRYLVLWCQSNDEFRPSFLCSWREIEKRIVNSERLLREVFQVRNGRHSFVDTVLSPHREFVRFDPACMLPATRYARKLMEDLSRAAEDTSRREIQWVPGLGVVIDNWQTLHARGEAKAKGTRALFRAWLD